MYTLYIIIYIHRKNTLKILPVYFICSYVRTHNFHTSIYHPKYSKIYVYIQYIHVYTNIILYTCIYDHNLIYISYEYHNISQGYPHWILVFSDARRVVANSWEAGNRCRWPRPTDDSNGLQLNKTWLRWVWGTNQQECGF